MAGRLLRRQGGSIRQFVAMPLGTGYTAEEQLTGEAVHGGLQVGVHPMKRNAYLEYRSSSVFENTGVCYSPPADKSSQEMGLAPGGLMKQELAADPHDFDVWEPHALTSTCGSLTRWRGASSTSSTPSSSSR